MDDTNLSRAGSILVVDDDPVVRSLMRATLETDDFEVIEAGDGVEGCRLYEERRPDLLLVDVVMPRMDGFELCRELRSRPASAFVPIVVATGLDDVPSITRAYHAGATDFIGDTRASLSIEVRDADIGAFAPQCQRNCPTDA